MIKKFILIIILIISLNILFIIIRNPIKSMLPRMGQINISGGVYTPYLNTNSLLYFFKFYDELVDMLIARSFADKALVELTLANKRILELEKLSRNEKFVIPETIIFNYYDSIQQSIELSRKASKNGEDIEPVVWSFQETLQDQEEIFNKIIERTSGNDQVIIKNLKKDSGEMIYNFLKERYRFF